MLASQASAARSTAVVPAASKITCATGSESESLLSSRDTHAHRYRHDAHGNGARQVLLDRLALEPQRGARELDRGHALAHRLSAGHLEDLPRPRGSRDGEATRHDLVDTRVELVCEPLAGIAHIAKDLRPIDGDHLVLLDGERHALLPYRAR